MVERVVRIHAELREERLMNREVLLHSQVGIEEVRAECAVPSCGTDLIQARCREALEWLRGQWHSGAMACQAVVIGCIELLNVQFQVVGASIWVARCTAWNGSSAFLIGECEGQTAGRSARW